MARQCKADALLPSYSNSDYPCPKPEYVEAILEDAKKTNAGDWFLLMVNLKLGFELVTSSIANVGLRWPHSKNSAEYSKAFNRLAILFDEFEQLMQLHRAQERAALQKHTEERRKTDVPQTQLVPSPANLSVKHDQKKDAPKTPTAHQSVSLPAELAALHENASSGIPTTFMCFGSDEALFTARLKSFTAYAATREGKFIVVGVGDGTNKDFMIICAGSKSEDAAFRGASRSGGALDKLDHELLTDDELRLRRPVESYSNFAQPGCDLISLHGFNRILSALGSGRYATVPIKAKPVKLPAKLAALHKNASSGIPTTFMCFSSDEALFIARLKSFTAYAATREGKFIVVGVGDGTNNDFVIICAGSKSEDAAFKEASRSGGTLDKLDRELLTDDELRLRRSVDSYSNFAQPGCDLISLQEFNRILSALGSGRYITVPIKAKTAGPSSLVLNNDSKT